MATTHRVTAWCGSLRAESFNRRLLQLAVGYLREKGAEVDWVDLKSPAFPLYDEDVERSGIPSQVLELKARVAAAGGMVIAMPEYNHSVPGGLKNAIDWVSRPPKDSPFKGRVAAIMGASTGPVGTARGQPHLRESLNALGVHLVPGGLLLPHAGDAFGPDGALVEPRKARELTLLMDRLLRDLDLRSPPPIG